VQHFELLSSAPGPWCWMASHHAKYTREENRLPGPPDDAITAQFLAVAEWPRLEAMLSDLAAERKEAGYSYGWYVTVALQRIHGLSPARLREIRARIKKPTGMDAKNFTAIHQISVTSVRQTEGSHRKASSMEEQSSACRAAEMERLKQQIRAVAAARAMR
jgi:hypothetical protein